MIKIFFLTLAIITGFVGYSYIICVENNPQIEIDHPIPAKNFWEVQSVDTMKYSRDLAAEKLKDVAFDTEIERQVKAVADLGSTHVAISTPYDSEFLPFMKRWVDVARKYDLKVWYRGNWSAWEGWFGYSENMTREQHITKTYDFIVANPDLFEDGDIFSSCPECENGGPGDPRMNGDVVGHRKFLIDDYQSTNKAFEQINKKVASNYFPMNADVARLVMDKKTTKALGGIITIDHYVKTPQQLVDDVKTISKNSGGRVILGEWGVAIPDINGNMTDDERSLWLDQALRGLSQLGKEEFGGMNYWLAVGGSTQLWKVAGEESKPAKTLASYYTPQVVYGVVRDEKGETLSSVKVKAGKLETVTDEQGYFEFKSLSSLPKVVFEKDKYEGVVIEANKTYQKMEPVLKSLDKSWQDSLKEFFGW
jgi:hypothetical protein